MSGDDPFNPNFETPKSEYNVALATAFYMHNLRIGINKAIWEKNLEAASELLSAFSCEIEGYYESKKKKGSEDILKKLKANEIKNKSILETNGANRDALLKNQIKEWRKHLIKLAHDIWFSKEQTNIYGDDYL